MDGQKDPNRTKIFIFLVTGMLVTGTINTVITKLLFTTNKAGGCCGWQTNGVPNTEPHNFTHPWFSTWIMFLGELLCFIPFIINRSNNSKKQKNLNINVPRDSDENPYSYIFALPTCCDLTASTLGNIALLWVPASIWQMMRGSIIIFGAILSKIFLKRVLRLHHWIGVSVVVIGLFLVGLSGFLGSRDTKLNPFFPIGLIFVIGAQLIAASQMIIEEMLLKRRSFEPLNVVFMEGFWGVVIMTLVALPILFFPQVSTIASPPYYFANGSAKYEADPILDGFSENVIDALAQMGNQSIFVIENVILLFSIAFFNFFGLSLVTYLTTVHRTLIDACRTIFVWLFQILLFWVGIESAGEILTIYSLVQLLGFAFLVAGTIIYNEVVKIPGSNYAKEEEK